MVIQPPQCLFNRRQVFDLYRVDLGTRAVSLHAVNPGDVTAWLADYDFNIRVGGWFWEIEVCMYVCMCVPLYMNRGGGPGVVGERHS
jgi:hypothetical protein